MSIFRKLTLVIAVILVASSVSGIFAVWTYATLPPEDASVSSNITLSEFTYHNPEEILPGGGTGTGGEEDDDGDFELEGANHYRLLDSILWNLEYGLNYTMNGQNKPAIHNALKEDGDVMHCEQTVQPGNMKFVLISEDVDTENLLFTMQRKTSTEYHLYTMLLTDAKKPAGTKIDVYKTILVVKDGEWTATESYLGTAITVKIKKVNGINVDTWVEK